MEVWQPLLVLQPQNFDDEGNLLPGNRFNEAGQSSIEGTFGAEMPPNVTILEPVPAGQPTPEQSVPTILLPTKPKAHQPMHVRIMRSVKQILAMVRPRLGCNDEAWNSAASALRPPPAAPTTTVVSTEMREKAAVVSVKPKAYVQATAAYTKC